MHGPAWKVPCLIELDRVTSVPETPVVKINQPQEESTRTTSLSRIGLYPLMRFIAFVSLSGILTSVGWYQNQLSLIYLNLGMVEHVM
jgi:hypothetical protein